MAKAEVVHGTRRGADVGWITGADENDDDTILVVGEHRSILGLANKKPMADAEGVDHGAEGLAVYLG
jgi:hypothetical protein